MNASEERERSSMAALYKPGHSNFIILDETNQKKQKTRPKTYKAHQARTTSQQHTIL